MLINIVHIKIIISCFIYFLLQVTAIELTHIIITSGNIFKNVYKHLGVLCEVLDDEYFFFLILRMYRTLWYDVLYFFIEVHCIYSDLQAFEIFQALLSYLAFFIKYHSYQTNHISLSVIKYSSIFKLW